MREEDGGAVALHADIEPQSRRPPLARRASRAAPASSAGEHRSSLAPRASRCASARAGAARARRRTPRATLAPSRRHQERKRPAVRRCRSAPSAAPAAIPDLDHPVGDRRALPVESVPISSTPGRVRARSARSGTGRSRRTGPTVCDGVLGDALTAPRAASCRAAAAEDDVPLVAERPLRLGRLQVEAATSSSRDFGSRTELKIGSYSNSGSPGKYICVTSRCGELRARRPRSGCGPGATRSSWLRHGYAPGLIVMNR